MVDTDAVVARRVRLVVACLLVPLILAALVAMALLWPHGDVKVAALDTSQARGTVIALKPCPDAPKDCNVARVKLTAAPGADKGRVVPVEVPKGTQTRSPVDTGDRIMLGEQKGAPLAERYQYVDHDRTRPLALLAGLFAIAVVALSRWRGVAALVALAVTALMLTQFVMPAILKGSNPLLVAVVGGSVIMVVALYLTHGVNAQTSVALAGTIAALGLTVGLGWAFVKLCQLSGLAVEGASNIKAYVGGLDLAGLLVAGMVIGALGVLDDVTVTQASAVWELSAANPSASRRSLVGAGLRIGRAHVASVVNTLVLAYAGAALPILMMFAVGGVPGGYVLSTELVAMEVVRGLVGSLGIIAAVPLTTALAAMAVADRSRDLVAEPEPLDPTPARSR
ncbi:MAG TPA: YibE/F family protein [Kribbella sp.]|nr:YibE/F family protein [Kribbella sp.]